MKRYLIYAMTLAAALLPACSFLDTDSASTHSPEVVYNNEAMVEKVLMGVYGKLTEDATYSQDLCFTLSAGSDIEIRQFDDKTPASSTDRAAANYLAAADNRQVTRAVDALYSAIERATSMIEGIEGSEAYASKNESILSMRAEAVVLRAQCYRDLVRMLGDVPFKMESTRPDLSNGYLPKSDRFLILETLIGQLVDCAADLPWRQSTPERITQGYARGLAAQLALMRAGWNYTTAREWEAPREDAPDYYAIAREQTELVMQEGGYALTQASVDADGNPMSGFKAFFYANCRREYLPEESLYEVGFKMGRSSELGYTIGPRVTTSTERYGYRNSTVLFTTPAYFYSFHPEDTRRDVSCYWAEYLDTSNTVQYPNGVESKTGLSQHLISNVRQIRIGKWDLTWMLPDFAQASYAAGGKIGTGVGVCMMRYADILLMYAEAENALHGATASAKEALWEVRSRAIPTMTRADFDAYLATKSFQQAVEDERAWEFLGERSRKWDLFRWGKLPQAIIEMREVNLRLFAEWEYDFEFDRTVDLYGREVSRSLPAEIYYAYDSRNMMIERANWDYTFTPSAEDAALFKKASDGKQWIYDARNGSKAQENIENYRIYLHNFASGLVDTDNVPVENGRPYFPVPSQMISDYGGVIGQDYGF